MEILAEILLGLLELFGELLLQLVLECLFEAGLHGVEKVYRRPKPVSPWLASLGYLLLGGIAGAISLWIFPRLFIASDVVRLLNLLLVPLGSGAVMAAIGVWRRKRDKPVIRLERFAYGFLFALAMAAVRFSRGH